jgi:hypothetical protein
MIPSPQSHQGGRRPLGTLLSGIPPTPVAVARSLTSGPSGVAEQSSGSRAPIPSPRRHAEVDLPHIGICVRSVSRCLIGRPVASQTGPFAGAGQSSGPEQPLLATVVGSAAATLCTSTPAAASTPAGVHHGQPRSSRGLGQVARRPEPRRGHGWVRASQHRRQCAVSRRSDASGQCSAVQEYGWRCPECPQPAPPLRAARERGQAAGSPGPPRYALFRSGSGRPSRSTPAWGCPKRRPPRRWASAPGRPGATLPGACPCSARAAMIPAILGSPSPGRRQMSACGIGRIGAVQGLPQVRRSARG